MKTELSLLIMTDGNPLMTLEQIARLRGIGFKTAQNQVYAKTLGIPVWKDGGGWFAHVSDVANWIDKNRAEAHGATASDATELLRTKLQPA